MNGRKLTVLTAITAILALGKFASAFGIALGEDGPDHPGWPFAAAFGVFFLIAAWLLRSGQRPGHRGCRICRHPVPVRDPPAPRLAQARRPGLDDRHRRRRGVTDRADRRHHGAGRASQATYG